MTLAVDFPNRGESTLALLNDLDSIVNSAAGDMYAAKDARMSPATFQIGYPRFKEFVHYRDPGISSGFSRRVMGS
jgi:hypothetical protein